MCGGASGLVLRGACPGKGCPDVPPGRCYVRTAPTSPARSRQRTKAVRGPTGTGLSINFVRGRRRKHPSRGRRRVGRRSCAGGTASRRVAGLLPLLARASGRRAQLLGTAADLVLGRLMYPSAAGQRPGSRSVTQKKPVFQGFDFAKVDKQFDSPSCRGHAACSASHSDLHTDLKKLARRPDGRQGPVLIFD